MTAPTSTYYAKAFCVKCLTDRNRTGGVWRNRMFFCGACRLQNGEIDHG